MDHVEWLVICFHWDGDIVSSGHDVSYVGGSEDFKLMKNTIMDCNYADIFAEKIGICPSPEC